jgi:hypothetical protein
MSNSGKRRRNPGVRAISKFQNNMKRVGKVHDTDICFFAYVAGLGVDEEIPCKDPSKTFTFHKQELYIILGSLQNINLKNPLIREIEAPKKRLALRGSWSNKAVASFKTQQETNPSFYPPEIRSEIYLEEGKMYRISGPYFFAKPGDILKFIGVRLECSRVTRSDLIEKYGCEDMGWFQFVKHVRNQPLRVQDQLKMLDHAGLYTSSIVPYDPSIKGRYNDAMTSFVLSLGPRGSVFEDEESGRFFQLDINYETVKYQVPASKEEKDAAAAKVGKSGTDADAPKVLQMGLGLNIAGVQGLDKEGTFSHEESFLLDIMIFPWDRVNFTGKEVRPGCLFNFGIVSRGIWKTIMPHYFHLMDITLIGSANWKRTAAYASTLGAVEGGLDHYMDDVAEDNPDNDRFGGGSSAGELAAKLAQRFQDDDEEDDDEMDDSGKGLSGKEGDPGLGKDGGNGAMPSFDFAYSVQPKNIVFDAKEFWTTHAIPVTPQTAEDLYLNYLRYTKRIQTDEDYPLSFKPMSQKHANDVFRNTNIICVTCGFERAEALINLDAETKQPKISGITGYYAAVPWRNLSEDYLEHIANLTQETGDALVKNLYNWEKIFKGESIPPLSAKSGKSGKAGISHAKALFDLEGGVPYFMDKKNAWEFVPALFVTWKDDDIEDYPETCNRLITSMTGAGVKSPIPEKSSPGNSEDAEDDDDLEPSPQKKQRYDSEEGEVASETTSDEDS